MKILQILCVFVLLSACSKEGAPQYAPAVEPPPQPVTQLTGAAPLAKMAAENVAADSAGASGA